MEPKDNTPEFCSLANLASDKIGAKVVFSTDDWYGVAENMIKTEEPSWDPNKFTEVGQYMDGWQTKHKEDIDSHDWCIIKLGLPGIVKGVDIDTSYFIGIQARHTWIQAANLKQDIKARGEVTVGVNASEEDFAEIEHLESYYWKDLLGCRDLGPGYKATCHHYFHIKSHETWTHIRFNIKPSGGVARVRVFGVPNVPKKLTNGKTVDLVAMSTGGVLTSCSPAHAGNGWNVISPGKASSMLGGWESAPLPAPDQEKSSSPWMTFTLGQPGIVTQLEVDTSHFHKNHPETCHIEACCDKTGKTWRTLMKSKPLVGDHCHVYTNNEMESLGVIHQVRLIIRPSGGISRLRLYGYSMAASTAKL